MLAGEERAPGPQGPFIAEDGTNQRGSIIVKVLFIINDAPYGSEKAYNALRMAMAIQKDHAEVEVLIFLLAD